MKCEFCMCEHDGSYGSGRFCSYLCKQKYVHYSRVDFSCKNKKHTTCKVCGREFSSTLDFRKHRAKERHYEKRGPNGSGDWVCKICNNVFTSRRELQRHKIEMKHYYQIEDVEKWSKSVSKSLRLFYENESDEHRRDRIAKSREIAKNNPEKFKGGVKRGCGRGKHGWYHGIWFYSSWELAYVIYCLEHDITIARYKGSFQYLYHGKIRKYHQDFLVSGTEIVEIKGYVTEQWKEKMSQLPKNIQISVIGSREIVPYLRYVVQKYGKDFVRLYGNGEVAESV